MIYGDNKLLNIYKKTIFDINYIPQKTKQWVLNKQNQLFSGQSANGGHYQRNNTWYMMVKEIL